MEEDKTKEKIEQSERLVEGNVKSFLLAPANFTQMERSSKNLTALLKVLGSRLIAKVYFILNAIGSPVLQEHSSCGAHEPSFQYWLSKNNRE
ncbi:hypothetical protein [Alteromonas sp. PRIM-21]|uniref:hypothetical protein n=1 Tax=Alteromonas sp. PRIM-21 TaxID=1454978 RepID=UPI0022B9C0F0|nr:hypothetical protein [Alteromonas sp. PRIM-21]MCZ8529589.1 hypothetical protein [Alteromonas sp. PRIM-21]